MTASAKLAGAGRKGYWTRDKIIEKILRWNELYGSPPVSADWNPSAAKWSASSWRIDRYKAGDPDTGEPWPSLNAAKKLFGGSISAAIVAAGLESNKPGPKARENVGPEVEREYTPDELRVVMGAARADARELRKTVEVRERQLERARAATEAACRALEAARRASRKTRVHVKTKTKTVTREDGRVKARAARLAEQVKSLKFEVKELKLAEREARMDAARQAARLERAEATVADLRGDRRELRRDLDRAEDTSKRLQGAAVKRKPEPEIREVVKYEEKIVRVLPPEQIVVDEARAEAADANAASRRAEERAVLAERRYMEIAEAATGERRVLSGGEMTELRRGGPSGEAALGAALRSLAKARKLGGRQPLKEALYEIASAAVRWEDRLK